jgi:glycosyltransferase involved in cell wall biosynthesis
LLLCGSLSCRKGVPEVLRAVAKLEPTTARRTALILVGRVREEDRGTIEQALSEAHGNGDLQVRMDDRFVPHAEFASTFLGSDAVLMPYQRTEGSSGVLGHAARAGKPVIGPQSGLLGELIRSYGLGATVDTTRADAIKDAIREFVSGQGSPGSVEGMEAYVRERSAGEFARVVLRME